MTLPDIRMTEPRKRSGTLPVLITGSLFTAILWIFMAISLPDPVSSRSPSGAPPGVGPVEPHAMPELPEIQARLHSIIDDIAVPVIVGALALIVLIVFLVIVVWLLLRKLSLNHSHAEIRAVDAESRAAVAESRAADAEVRAARHQSARSMGYLSTIPDDENTWFFTWNHMHRVFIHSDHAEQIAYKSNAFSRSTPPGGLAEFSDHCHYAVAASGKGDPFSDHLLVRIESELERISEALVTEHSSLRRLPVDGSLSSDLAATVRPYSPSEPSRPVIRTFRLGPHGAKALHCLLRYDSLICLALALTQSGSISQAEYRRIRLRFELLFRRLFMIASGFATWGCTRKDLREENSIARVSVQHHIRTGLIKPGSVEDLLHEFCDHPERPSLIEGTRRKFFPGSTPWTYPE